MITLHRLGHPAENFYVNHEMVVSVEATPDTVIRLMTGDKILVAESPHEVADKIKACCAEIMGLAMRLRCEDAAADDPDGAMTRALRLSLLASPPESFERPAQ